MIKLKRVNEHLQSFNCELSKIYLNTFQIVNAWITLWYNMNSIYLHMIIAKTVKKRVILVSLSIEMFTAEVNTHRNMYTIQIWNTVFSTVVITKWNTYYVNNVVKCNFCKHHYNVMLHRKYEHSTQEFSVHFFKGWSLF